MNIPNNKRKKDSKEKIEKVFLTLIQTKDINEITVTDICKNANLNRTTFYSNYIDIYDLADKIKEKLENDITLLYKDDDEKYSEGNFLKLFQHIKENQIFYKTYFKLNFDLTKEVQFIDEEEVYKYLGSSKNIEYHIAFFKAGLNAIIKKWLDDGCDKAPEEIEEILKQEYKRKRNIMKW